MAVEFIDAVHVLLENTAKEIGYIALRDKPEKEPVFLGKDVFVSGPDRWCGSPQRVSVCVTVCVQACVCTCNNIMYTLCPGAVY